MRKRILILITLIIPVISLPQVSADKKYIQNELEWSKVCGGLDSIMAKKGIWKKLEDDLAFPDKTFPRSQYKLVNTRIDSMLNFVKEAIMQLNGIEPRWYRGMRGSSHLSNGPVPYNLTTLFFDYYCNTNVNKILLADETNTWAYVFVNHLSWFMYDADTLDINDEGEVKTVFQLPPVIGKWKGYKLYELKGSMGRSARSVIIGRDGKLPWRTLTQKQYLTGLKNKWEKDLKKFRPGSSYESDYTKKLKYIHDYLLSTDEKTLQQPVIIDPKSGIWGFKGKFGDEETGGFRLVLSGLGEKYFDKTLPRHVPQLIQLYWCYGYSSPEQLFKEQFEENFPVEKLKAMIR
jgi:hypothetical protein